MRLIGRLCKIPKGAEPLLLFGFLGGYPIGAKNIQNAAINGVLDTQSARRMLGFCNNAGPAFIFGMVSCLFESSGPCWALWFIHIVSAIIVGILLPGCANGYYKHTEVSGGTFLTDVEKSTKTMAVVCCWVILFRVLINFGKRWLFWMFPAEIQLLITGVTELSNGIIDLTHLSYPGLRFVLSSVLLGLGGFCVAMQTVSITGNLGSGYYFPGKLLQGCLSFTLALILQPVFFSESEIFRFPLFLNVGIIMFGIIILMILYRNKNNSRIMAQNLI